MLCLAIDTFSYVYSKPKQSKSSLFMSGWLSKAKTSSPEKKIVAEIKPKRQPEKSPKKPNMMLNWLGKGNSPQKDNKEKGEPASKRFKPSDSL